jgi:hypothetical protein
MDELFASGITLAYDASHSFIFEVGDETEVSNLKQNNASCPSLDVCFEWANYHRNVSILLSDMSVETFYPLGIFFGENGEPFLCRLEDGVMFSSMPTMLMFFGDPLLKRVNEIIGRVVEAGIYKFWISLHSHWLKFWTQKIAIFQPFEEYYSFNLYHMLPAFYLLLIGWCLSALFFMVEVIYNRLLSKVL